MVKVKPNLISIINTINFVIIFALNLYAAFKLIEEIHTRYKVNKKNKKNIFGFTTKE